MRKVSIFAQKSFLLIFFSIFCLSVLFALSDDEDQKERQKKKNLRLNPISDGEINKSMLIRVGTQKKIMDASITWWDPFIDHINIYVYAWHIWNRMRVNNSIEQLHLSYSIFPFSIVVFHCMKIDKQSMYLFYRLSRVELSRHEFIWHKHPLKICYMLFDHVSTKWIFVSLW